MNGELESLFNGGAYGDGEARQLTVVTRHGQPLLYLPRSGAQAVQAMSLYPAQRTAARLARALLRFGCSCGLARFLPSTTLTLHGNAPLGQFLRELLKRETIPDFAILAGNPNASGRRFILLLFDKRDRPCAVVKAGMSQEAVRLLEQEMTVLEHMPSHALGLPQLRGVHREERLSAFVLDHAEGNAPEPNANERMREVLASWIDATRSVTVREVPSWKRLTEGCPDHPTLGALRSRVETTSFHPVLYHGDFAPWNIKVGRTGAWKVLDWERGELVGIPCWDWFHFLVQPALLVDRSPTGELAQLVNQWLSNDHFTDYARAVGVHLIVRDLFLAYLLYCTEILKPSEGLQATHELVTTLTRQWNVD